MEIKASKFIVSNTDVAKCPPPGLPEYAFIGRSNVGKSSLINMLTGRKKLAKISGTPGKTQLINHFLINDAWYMVDLPGYGYAKISKSQRRQWVKMIDGYLLKRQNLMCTFLLIDSRIPLQQNDLDFMNRMGTNRVPFVLLYTKTDKLSKKKLSDNLQAIRSEILKYWETLPSEFVTSAATGRGRDDILEFIDEWNTRFEK